MKTMKSIMLLLLSLVFLLSLTGCGLGSKPSAGEQTAPPEPTAKPVPTAEPTVVPTPQPLSDTVVLPDGWTVDQAISAEEVEAIVGITGYQFYPEGANDASIGNPSGSFTNPANAKRKVSFYFFSQGKEAKYLYFRDFAVEGSVTELTSELWDMAYIAGFKDDSAAIVLLRGEMCMRINWFPQAHEGFTEEEMGRLLAGLAINNLYGGARMETPTQTGGQDVVATADIPDELPADLTDVAALNQFATNLYMEYAGGDVFTASVYTAQDRANARKALPLIIEAMDKAIEMYDQNSNFYFLRGKAYAQCYYDAGLAADKQKGLADLQQALDMGLTMAQSVYDKLSGS